MPFNKSAICACNDFAGATGVASPFNKAAICACSEAAAGNGERAAATGNGELCSLVALPVAGLPPMPMLQPGDNNGFAADVAT